MARYNLTMRKADKTLSQEIGIQVLENDAQAVAFAQRVIESILHRNFNRYPGWSIDIAVDTRAVASVCFDAST